MIRNDTGFEHAFFRKLGPGGHTFEVFALKATFELDPRSHRLKLAEIQAPVRLSDRYEGPGAKDPLGMVVAESGDAVLFKPGSDVWVTGTARSQGERLLRRWSAGIAVGMRRHIVELHGPREWRQGLLRWRLSAAEPCTSVPLDYRLSFGGHWTLAAEAERKPVSVQKLDNPAGCGWLPDGSALSALPAPMRSRMRERWAGLSRMQAPQILLPSQDLHHPSQSMPTAGFGPLARWWHPRTTHLGTRDAQWRAEQYPNYPADFDLRFFQAAPAALQGPEPLRGDERVALIGLLPEGEVCWELPAVQPTLEVRFDNASAASVGMRLDTLALDLDQRRLCLTWRALFASGAPPRDIAVHIPAADLERIGGSR